MIPSQKGTISSSHKSIDRDVSFLVSNFSGQLSVVSEGVALFFKKTKSSLIDQCLFDLVGKEAQNKLQARLLELKKGDGDSASLYIQFLTEEGIKTVLTDITLIGEDVFHFRLMLDQFSENQNGMEHLTSLFEDSPFYFWTLDEDMKFVYANKAAQKAFERFYAYSWKKGDEFARLFKADKSSNSIVWMDNCYSTLKNRKTSFLEITESSDSGFSHIKAEVHPFSATEETRGIYCLVNDESEKFLKNELQQAISRFKSKLLQTFSINELLWCITDEVLANLYLEDAIILMKNKDMLQSKTAYGSKRKGDRRIDGLLEINVGQGVVGKVARTGKALIVNDTDVSSDYFKDHFDAGSEIAVPINLNGEIIGVINCESSYKNFFRPFHLEILSEVAKVTAERIDQIITERKYRKVQELNYAVLNSTPSSYLLLNTKQEVISFNRISNVAMRFYTGKEIKLRTHFTEYFPVEFKTELENLFDSSLKGKLNKIEKQIHHSKAGELWFRATFAPAKNKIGKPFGVTLIVENITKDKQTEALILKQNERLTKTNEELDKFIYSVSHDLRSPVSSVIGITTLIDLTDNVNELKEYGQLIHGSMQRMDDFIRNVLDYSKNARIHINTEEVDFQELIKNIITDHSYMRETGKIDVRHNIECSSLITDRQRLSIIISNLLSNAIKYHDSSKEEQFIEISTSCDETYFMLSIKDNGLGIKEEHQSNLFEMFYTANSKAQGSGIGLYILSDTVKILGGEVSFTSKYGEGTEFIVKLPKVLAVAETSLD